MDVDTESSSSERLQGAPSTSSNDKQSEKKLPIVVIVIGMAGSGKTTLMQRLVAQSHQNRTRSYVINLDPAVMTVPYPTNIDIRDTVKYKNVMKEYRLGPNGGILTSLNLFATKFDEVIGLVEKRAPDLDVVFVDTPGQIEIFTWSASGAIITEAFASTFPTVVCYVIDTPRSASPSTFMSNMLYACGILYKTRLPMLLTFNKTDVKKHEFALQWMDDFEVFQAALEEDSSFSASLTRSLCLVLDEFYRNLKTVGVSAVTGSGIVEFFKKLEESKEDYISNYLVELDEMKTEAEKSKREKEEADLAKLRADLAKEKLTGIRSQFSQMSIGSKKAERFPEHSDDDGSDDDGSDDDDYDEDD